MFKVSLLLFACLALASARRSSRILHGKEVTQQQARGIFGFVAHVWTCKGRGCGSCTGSLVTPNRILVAAHCLCSNPNRIQVKSTSCFPGFHGFYKLYFEQFETSLQYFSMNIHSIKADSCISSFGGFELQLSSCFYQVKLKTFSTSSSR